jgi:hypothetical protein
MDRRNFRTSGLCESNRRDAKAQDTTSIIPILIGKLLMENPPGNLGAPFLVEHARA